MPATVRIHKWRRPNEEPKYKLTVAEGTSKLDLMGVPKEAERKVQMIERLKGLGASGRADRARLRGTGNRRPRRHPRRGVT